MTTETTTRQNRDGHPCPPWCRTDHPKSATDICVGGGSTGMEADALPDHFWTRAIRSRDGVEVGVSAALDDPGADWPHLSLDQRAAGHLAAMIEMLADATPEQLRGLAASLRQAAAQITEASQ